MDTRMAPFGGHPDGGKIKQFAAGEEIPDYMLELSTEAIEILKDISKDERVSYILNSTEPELWKAREDLKKRLNKRSVQIGIIAAVSEIKL